MKTCPAMIVGCLMGMFVGVAIGAENPFLRTLVDTTPNGVVIAYGTNPGSLVAANVVRDEIRKLSGQSTWSNVQPAASFDAQPFATTGQVHVIAVGTLADNVVLRGRGWLPTWWMDWGWYVSQAPDRITGSAIGLPYQANSGFLAGGYGAWTSEDRVGLVEVDRSHLFMEWMVRSRVETLAGGPVPGSGNFNNTQNKMHNKDWVEDAAQFTSAWPVYPKDFPLRLIVRITGSGTAGVQAAATAFAGGMLNGVVLNGAAAGSGPPQAALAPTRYIASLPAGFTPPAGNANCTYQGFLHCDAFDYDGATRRIGVAPQLMFRLKYKPISGAFASTNGITNFWTTPQRRASEFEILCMRFSDAPTASAAKASMDAAVAGLPSKNGLTNYATTTNGRYLYAKSMLDAHGGAAMLAACSAQGGW